MNLLSSDKRIVFLRINHSAPFSCLCFFLVLRNHFSLKRVRVKMSKNSQTLDYDSFDLTPLEKRFVKEIFDLPYEGLREEIILGRLSSSLSNFLLGLFWTMVNQLLARLPEPSSNEEKQT